MTKKRLYSAGGWVYKFGDSPNKARYVTAVFKARDNKRARKMALLQIGRQWYIEQYTIPQMDKEDIYEVEIFKHNQYELKKKTVKKSGLLKETRKTLCTPLRRGYKNLRASATRLFYFRKNYTV